VIAKRLLVLVLAPYVLWLVFAYEYHFLDGVNLAFHEAGHLFFGLLGRTLHFLGGTLGQLFFPVACIVHFLRQDRPFEAAVCAVWLGESGMYAAEYIADARVQALPLVGGHVHDWNWLLRRAGLLAQAERLGALVHVLSSGVVLGALGWAAKLACARDPGEVRQAAPASSAPRP
jgi:hypothetical protein